MKDNSIKELKSFGEFFLFPNNMILEFSSRLLKILPNPDSGEKFFSISFYQNESENFFSKVFGETKYENKESYLFISTRILLENKFSPKEYLKNLEDLSDEKLEESKSCVKFNEDYCVVLSKYDNSINEAIALLFIAASNVFIINEMMENLGSRKKFWVETISFAYFIAKQNLLKNDFLQKIYEKTREEEGGQE